MEMDEGWGRDFESLEEDWQRTGSYMWQAMKEVAFDVGGEPLLAQVCELEFPESVLPNPEILQLLKSRDLKSVERVMDRFEQIGDETRRRELNELGRPRRRVRHWGRTLLEGVAPKRRI